MINKAKYSQQLVNLAEIYVINGVCVKSRGTIPKDVTKKEIDLAKDNHLNIIIQDNDKIDIYCDKEFSKSFKYYIDKYAVNHIKISYETGNIELHIK